MKKINQGNYEGSAAGYNNNIKKGNNLKKHSNNNNIYVNNNHINTNNNNNKNNNHNHKNNTNTIGLSDRARKTIMKNLSEYHKITYRNNIENDNE